MINSVSATHFAAHGHCSASKSRECLVPLFVALSLKALMKVCPFILSKPSLIIFATNLSLKLTSIICGTLYLYCRLVVLGGLCMALKF